jgi:hypothetical protein
MRHNTATIFKALRREYCRLENCPCRGCNETQQLICLEWYLRLSSEIADMQDGTYNIPTPLI